VPDEEPDEEPDVSDEEPDEGSEDEPEDELPEAAAPSSRLEREDGFDPDRLSVA
jgi:hypothetical protein